MPNRGARDPSRREEREDAPREIFFEWDRDKAEINERKHGVSFYEAITAFGDPRSLTIYDEEHSDDEDRWILVGMSLRERLLSVGHAERGDRIRIFGAREAGPRQRRAYEEGEEEDE